MMRIDIITCVPGIFDGFKDESIVGRSVKNKFVNLQIHNLRDFTEDKHRKVDDYPYGGGPGMVLKIEPIANCIEFLKSQREYDEIIYMCPDAEVLNQKMCNILSMRKNLMILCGRYKGIDERVREYYITKEISIGKYVLTGGELAASVLIDSIIRLIPGVISDSLSALEDSFQNDQIASPVYTRPYDFKGKKVPSILLSGDLPNIKKWKNEKSFKKHLKSY